ncbi:MULTISPECIES: manganese-dependent inorganic pyrophosphatase [Lentilactobacillus]|jgi:manganese-dependent inorganic pyrophosphatase|uniref:Probable manganese-dependent inorganic pyrophosphatase n=4 Tax=Lentilactobacillus parabuchneri TaxID=152331 RepID=A0A1X1FBN1_9LACO|nr:manganese-dependent inorganic pyrophosphatase [Lentilactobacillus parabuchneri]APR08487.1 Manganese-dependent inorganic pyrophosphatase [Lentilactobacillus parabuchneri]KRM47853.1 manganese-dependent inorganic pyrophosphatase [Lentilactobacillus parabuchneri DSM 5707 = NBRC 107865]KRN80127.1 manganese-dependent inorganic pyrophosphatase [Lentilactobacillus parabuchneri]MBW0221927.1 manganese-dependent inorganic pyrophosphatase [Lentilactobacillus parabuchneri]MBW0244849.1 manganese-dependen
MSKELVFGHQSPDTDAIVAAKAFSYLQNQLGYDTEAVALGEPSPETAFVLNYFDEPTPRIIKTAKNEVDSVMLVDHNEFQQSVSDIKDLTITHVVDHHRISNFQTDQPLYYRAEPVGCCSTIIVKMFDENKIEIPVQLAGLMLSAIISDTLLLKSPTTTEEDKIAVKTLAEIADIDYEKYGVEMLKAGTNVSAKSDQELIDQDAKSFTMGGKSVRIDQINVVEFSEIDARKDDIEKAMKAESADKGYDLFLVLITNVLNSDSKMLVVGDPISAVEKAFNAKISNNTVSLPGVVSRKKQVVPPLTDALS